MAWMCHCGTRNSGLNQQCAAGLTWKHVEHYQVSSNGPDYLMALIAAKGLGMTPQEELYAEFYNKAKVLVADMDVATLRQHREVLAQIAFEARANLAAADDELRERRAKEKKKEWLVTPVEPSQVHSDAINAVKIRKERMSKMDKLKTQLLNAGIDEATVKEMVADLERKATEKNLKTITFKKTTIETAAVQVQAKKPVNGENLKPFDPSSLKFEPKKN